MKLRAPAERKSTKARVNWLLRQLQKAASTNIHVRLFWPGRASFTQYPLVKLREHAEIAEAERNGLSVLSFEVLLVKDLGGRFGQRRNFIGDLEEAIPEFYDQVGQHLRAWQPSAPRLREEKADPATVAPDAMGEEAEAIAATGDE